MMILAEETEGDLLDDDQLVEVREYLRYRRSRWETVREHERKWPRSREAKSSNE